METLQNTLEQEKRLLLTIRGLTIFFIVALALSGITAFPVESELRLLDRIFDLSNSSNGLLLWVGGVYKAVVDTNASYPFLAYGYDWLAFAHLTIAVAFIGVYLKPVRNIWIVHFGMIACIGVIPLALICGAIREIPILWRMIDCSFGVFGIIPLYILHINIRKLEKLIDYKPAKY